MTASSGPERRKPGSRVPFEALVEIAAPEGTSFEAESVDLSSAGMHLKTAYLPKIGTPLTFRFDADGAGAPVVVNGEVVWSSFGEDGVENGGEFGVRFRDVAGEDAELLRKIVGESGDGTTTFTADGMMRPGSSVRIHIEGMQAPMRATLRNDAKIGAIVGSELKMLRIGAVVELEDKEKRVRRPARVDGVACEIDEETRVPQLVVKLRYDQQTHASEAEAFLPTRKAPMPADVETAAREVRASTNPPQAAEQARVSLPVAKDEAMSAEASDSRDSREMSDSRDSDAGESASHSEPKAMGAFGDKMKIALGGAAAYAQRFGARIGTTVSLLAKRGQSEKQEEEGSEVRRTTSKFTSIGGSSAQRRTLRPQTRDVSGSNGDEEVAMEEIDSKKVMRRRQIGIAAGVGIAVVLGFLAFRKPHPKDPVVQAPTPELAPAASATVAAAPPPALSATPALPADTVAAAPAPLVGDSTGVDAKGNPNPFGTPSVKKGTKMLLRLDGPVTEIKGMQMPNGFVVSVPNRKSLEAAGPLAAKDPRISSAKVVNQPGGAELTIAFKDDSPAYVVKAKGDALEIVLAHEKAIAKKGKGKNGGTPAHKAPHKKNK